MKEGRIQLIIDRIFSYPEFSNFFRSIAELGFAETKKTIKKELDCSKKTLDIGCGAGTFSILFQDYVGIDVSPKFIRYAARKYSREFHIMDAANIRFESGSFDNALVVGLLHHLDDESFLKAVSEIKKVLKKNGKALILEDIPVQSFINIIGGLAHRFDLGGNIRGMEDYQRLLEKELHIEKSYKIRNGVGDYGVFVLTKRDF